MVLLFKNNLKFHIFDRTSSFRSELIALNAFYSVYICKFSSQRVNDVVQCGILQRCFSSGDHLEHKCPSVAPRRTLPPGGTKRVRAG